MADQNMLPNFFIIGAPKAGTTSLFNILEQHPQVYGSTVKETGFFTKDNRYVKGLDWYEKTYFKKAMGYPVRMEATPAYLTWSEKSAPRLFDEYPIKDLKFAVIFRDPVKRAYSHYWHRVRLGQEPLSFEEAIKQEPSRILKNYDEFYRAGNGLFGYFRAGCYASRLQPFLERFDKTRFLFLLQEDIFPAEFDRTAKKMQEFLDLNETTPLTYQKSNQATIPRKNWFIALYWKLKHTFLGQIYRKTVNDQVRKSIYATVFPPSSYPPMNEDFANQLRQKYVPEIKELEQIIERDLSEWYS